MLEPYRRQMAEKAWADEELKALVLLAVAFDAHGENGRAVEVLDEALTLAEPGGFIRVFVDEGAPMARLLYEACPKGSIQTTFDTCWRRSPHLDGSRLPPRGRRPPRSVWKSPSARGSSRFSTSSPLG